MKKLETLYLDSENLIVTHLTGELDTPDINEWNASLERTTMQLQPNTKFKILVNLHGFKALNFDAHKKFRVVIPTMLARYGWYVGYLRMFPEATVTISSKDDIYCIAAAHVHQDETKINNYSDNYQMKNEGFFTDPELARKWLDSIPVK
jgi:hypothetical protein